MKRKPANRRPNTSCDLCGKGIYRRPSTLARNAGKFCSHSCSSKVYGFPEEHRGPGARGRKGSANPSWKGGVTYKRAKGSYSGVRYVRCPEEFLVMARKDGYVMEHRLVVAMEIGRPLTRTEVVHHIDHQPSNNSVMNLMLFHSNGEHKRYEGKH